MSAFTRSALLYGRRKDKQRASETSRPSGTKRRNRYVDEDDGSEVQIIGVQQSQEPAERPRRPQVQNYTETKRLSSNQPFNANTVGDNRLHHTDMTHPPSSLLVPRNTRGVVSDQYSLGGGDREMMMSQLTMTQLSNDHDYSGPHGQSQSFSQPSYEKRQSIHHIQAPQKQDHHFGHSSYERLRHPSAAQQHEQIPEQDYPEKLSQERQNRPQNRSLSDNQSYIKDYQARRSAQFEGHSLSQGGYTDDVSTVMSQPLVASNPTVPRPHGFIRPQRSNQSRSLLGYLTPSRISSGQNMEEPSEWRQRQGQPHTAAHTMPKNPHQKRRRHPWMEACLEILSPYRPPNVG